MPTRAWRVATRSRKSPVVGECRVVAVMGWSLEVSERVPRGFVLLAQPPEGEAEALGARHVARGGDRGRVAVPDVVARPRRVGVGEVQLLGGGIADRLGAGRGDQL